MVKRNLDELVCCAQNSNLVQQLHKALPSLKRGLSDLS